MPPLANEKKYAFSFLPPPPFEIETRYSYLKNHTQIRKIGVMHDPSPYGRFLDKAAEALAPKYGLKVVVDETYQQEEADLSNEIDRIHGAGGEAVMMLGQGAAAVTAAKDIKHLGLTHMMLLDSINETNILITAGNILGDRFLFPLPYVQLYQHDPEKIPAGPLRVADTAFLKLWNQKYPNVDPSQGSRAWDSMMMIDKAATMAKSLKGAAIIAAMEKMGTYVGAGASYEFTPKDHIGVRVNPYVLAAVKDGKMYVVK
jgi:ABC-type branched-subunit amino acid transport system substrate-binding protein